MVLPSGPTSWSETNRVASVLVRGVTSRLTVDAPVIRSRVVRGAEVKLANCPGRLVRPVNSDVPEAALSRLDNPGRLEMPAGLPPAGALICWAAPRTVTEVRCAAPPTPG